MNEERRDLWARTVNREARSDNWVQPHMPPNHTWWNDWLDATARLLKAHNVDHITITYTDEWVAGENFTGHEYRRFPDGPPAR